MQILVLGGDGYLCWPTALHLSAAGHDLNQGVVYGADTDLAAVRPTVRRRDTSSTLQQPSGALAEA